MLRHLMKFLLLPMIAIGLLSSCTPLQITQFESQYGVDLSPEVEAQLLHDQEVIDYVNNLPYAFGEWEPARLAWRTVMSEHFHWDQAKIDRNEAFAENVVMGESVGCPNVTGYTTMVYPPRGCEIAKLGSGSDAGFGQVTSAGWGRGGTACIVENICSREAVVSSPWNSMVTMGVLMDVSGRYAWCDYIGAKGHACYLWQG